MKRKAKKQGAVGRKERHLTQAELKKISAGIKYAADVFGAPSHRQTWDPTECWPK